MKKKLILTVLAVVCSLCCALGLAACDNGPGSSDGKVAAKIEAVPEHVSSVSVSYGNTYYLSCGTGSSDSRRIEKGKEYLITVHFEQGYDVGSLKMHINGSQTALQENSDDYGSFYWYTCTYSPTSDFTVTFSGEATVSTKIELRPAQLTLQVGYSGYFEIYVHQGAENEPAYDLPVSVASSNPNVATAELITLEEGQRICAVNAVGQGTATIGVTAGYKTATCAVTVTSATQVESITLEKTQITLDLEFNKSTSFGVSVTPDVRVQVASDNTAVATAWSSYNTNEEGGHNTVNVEAVGEGTATITVTAGDKTATCKVTVNGQPEAVNGSAGLEYTLDYDGYYYLSGIGDCTETEITVANYYQGVRVAGINNSALMNCTSITSLTIPNGITQINYRAFYGCTALESVTIGRDVTKIGDGAFNNCNSISRINIDTIEHWCTIKFEGYALPVSGGGPVDYELYVGGQKPEGDIKVPDGVTSIAYGLFYNCKYITGVNLPDSVKVIYANAFYNCVSLTDINLPNGVTTMGSWAFKGCVNLTNITIPANVTVISDGLFYGCEGLSSIAIPDGVTTIGSHTFADCENLSSIAIPGSVTYIGEWAFDNCSSLASVNIPNGVTYIGSRAFKGCSSITSITIPGGVENIYQEVFYGCRNLASVTIQDGITSLGDNAFACCENLTAVTIPGSVKSIGEYAFGWCNGLSSVTIGEGVESIGENAFYECAFTNIVIPDSVTSMDAGVFRNCANISSITVPFVGSTKEDAEYLYFGYIFGGAYSFNSEVPESLKTVTVTGGTIGENAFGHCGYLVSITISEGVQYIADTAFDYCSSLTEIIIPDGLDVSNVSLEGCDSFEGTLVGNFYLFGTKLLGIKEVTDTVIISSNITAIGANAFKNPAEIKYVYIPTSVKRVESGVFDGFTGHLFVGGILLDGLDTYPEFTVEYSAGDCTVDGWIYKSISDNIKIMAYIGVGGEVTVPVLIDGRDVIEIGDGSTAFRTFLQREDITKLTFNSTRVSINEWAIENCTNLAEIVIGANVNSFNIPPKAINGCTSLTAITLEGGYDNYQVYFQSMAGVSGPYAITDGEYLLSVVQGLPNGSACMITKKGALSL